MLILDPGPEDSSRRGTVVKRAKGEDCHPIGIANRNPILDTCRYDVDIDGVPHEYTANHIAKICILRLILRDGAN